MRFANPKLLWLLTLVVPMTAYYVYRLRQGRATMRISTVSGLRGVPRGARSYLRHAPFVLRCGAVALLVVALARPQSSQSDSSRTTEGIDIVLSLDISGSMLARDFQPDRISAAKEVAASFIADRPNDRIGLVVFAGESFTQSPLTTDKASLLNILGTVRSGMIDDGTAIGNGLATAVNRLRESQARQVVILLTDGVNNSGQIAPLTAADASTLGIRVYAIGVGSEGQAPYPALDMWGNLSFVPMKVEIDEEILSDIADKTGGRYFRATDNEKLREIYKEINRLEKSRVEVESQTRYDERFAPFVLGALLLLAAGFAMRRLWFRQIP
ncbi:MAG: vWA domain-containing protein [Alistipes sp.]